MSASDPKPGPANPAAEGIDAPTPPGGPQRQDRAGEGLTGDDTGTAPPSQEQHGGTIAVEDEQPRPTPEPEETPLQEENAETSLDQPSEG